MKNATGVFTPTASPTLVAESSAAAVMTGWVPVVTTVKDVNAVLAESDVPKTKDVSAPVLMTGITCRLAPAVGVAVGVKTHKFVHDADVERANVDAVVGHPYRSLPARNVFDAAWLLVVVQTDAAPRKVAVVAKKPTGVPVAPETPKTVSNAEAAPEVPVVSIAAGVTTG